MRPANNPAGTVRTPASLRPLGGRPKRHDTGTATKTKMKENVSRRQTSSGDGTKKTSLQTWFGWRERLIVPNRPLPQQRCPSYIESRVGGKVVSVTHNLVSSVRPSKSPSRPVISPRELLLRYLNRSERKGGDGM